MCVGKVREQAIMKVKDLKTFISADKKNSK